MVGATVPAGLLVAAASAFTSASYFDPAGDANEVPDITSVIVGDTTPGAVNIRVTVSNFQELPSDSRIILQLDLDRNATTGVAGDELVVRYWDDETSRSSAGTESGSQQAPRIRSARASPRGL